jgi:hypothetical protein
MTKKSTEKPLLKEGNDTFVFTKKNYQIMIVGLLVIFLGYFLKVLIA